MQLHRRRDVKAQGAGAAAHSRSQLKIRCARGRRDRFCPLTSTCCGVRSRHACRHAACRVKSSQSRLTVHLKLPVLRVSMDMEWTPPSHVKTWPEKRFLRSEPESRFDSVGRGSRSNAQGGEEAKGLKPSPLGLAISEHATVLAASCTTAHIIPCVPRRWLPELALNSSGKAPAQAKKNPLPSCSPTAVIEQCRHHRGSWEAWSSATSSRDTRLWLAGGR